MTDETQFFLASSSPRRHDLLAGMGLKFEVIRFEIDESHIRGESPIDYAARIASLKAEHGSLIAADENRPRLPVLAADTCVVSGKQILGKPTDLEQARWMLGELSGQTHEVVSAVAVKKGATMWQDVSRSRVTFDCLSPEKIDAYCATGEPMDKAGAYAVQGLGSAFVIQIEGSYTGVMGLPMYETYHLLKNAGVDWL